MVSKKFNYIVYREGEYYVTQCINVDVSSFGETIDAAVYNLKEAVSLYFEDHDMSDLIEINDIMLGDSLING